MTSVRIAWWQAGKDPTQPWTKEMVSAKQPGATNIHPADVNGDGKMDLIASRGHGVGVVWFERETDSATWSEHTIDGELREPHCLAAIDLDRDGDIDVATVAFGSERAMWYENDGRGNFKSHLIGEKQQAYDIRVIDLDKDGDLDLVVAGRASPTSPTRFLENLFSAVCNGLCCIFFPRVLQSVV